MINRRIIALCAATIGVGTALVAGSQAQQPPPPAPAPAVHSPAAPRVNAVQTKQPQWKQMDALRDALKQLDDVEAALKRQGGEFGGHLTKARKSVLEARQHIGMALAYGKRTYGDAKKP